MHPETHSEELHPCRVAGWTGAGDIRMAAHGITVLHFTPHPIRAEPATVIAAIRSALAAARIHPRLPIRTIAATPGVTRETRDTRETRGGSKRPTRTP
jgi:hypothetical protein